jgi:hypothetical protein
MATGVRITANATPARLDAVTADSKTGHTVIIKNAGAEDLVLGASNVTAATGFRLAAGQTLTVELFDPESIYGVSASGSNLTVDVLRVS